MAAKGQGAERDGQVGLAGTRRLDTPALAPTSICYAVGANAAHVLSSDRILFPRVERVSHHVLRPVRHVPLQSGQLLAAVLDLVDAENALLKCPALQIPEPFGEAALAVKGVRGQGRRSRPGPDDSADQSNSNIPLLLRNRLQIKLPM